MRVTWPRTALNQERSDLLETTMKAILTRREELTIMVAISAKKTSNQIGKITTQVQQIIGMLKRQVALAMTMEALAEVRQLVAMAGTMPTLVADSKIMTTQLPTVAVVKQPVEEVAGATIQILQLKMTMPTEDGVEAPQHCSAHSKIYEQ